MSITVNGATKVAGVIGDPIHHTRSPAMHNAAFRALDLNWVYVPFHVRADSIEHAIEGMRGFGIRGLNVTVPHKQAVAEAVDRLTPAARAVRAVNTILWDGDELVGDNTDVDGILGAAKDALGEDEWPEEVVVLGAGGAARGMVYALTTVPQIRRVTILNRTVQRAEELARDLDGETIVEAGPLSRTKATAAISKAGLLINVTNLGRGDLADLSPVEKDWNALHDGLILVDSNYDPPVTPLMEQVRAVGGRATNGLDMLVYQGAKSFRLWTGMEAPVDVMRRAIAPGDE